MTLEYENKSPQFTVFKGKVVTLTLDANGVWHDEDGTVWPLATDNYSNLMADNRCGVGLFSLPAGDPRNAGCGPHDFLYSSPYAQSVYKRSWADEYLRRLEEQLPDGDHILTPEAMKFLARQEGFHFWENEATND